MRKILLITTLLCGAAIPANSQGDGKPTAASSGGSFTGATANFAPNAPAGQWTQQARDYANTRYSPLTQINKQNVGRLRMAWSFSDGQMYGHEGAPLVVGDTMYLVTPFPNIAYALDLSKPGAPIKWVFQPNPDPRAIGKACCDKVLRGWSYADGKLIYNLLDNNTVAVDAQTGKEVWRVKLDDVTKGPTMTMSAFVVGDRVYVANSGGEMGINGWFQALDVKDGHTVWKAFNNGPDQGMLIGSDFKPHYPWMVGKDLGVTTWPGEMWKQGASAAWGWVSYDPDLNAIYYGTSNPGPRTPSQRPGLNLWSAAVFARDATTGAAKWAYQFTPHDEWDYDGVNENVLIEIPWKGARRKVLVHFNRNGFAYTIDRTNGEVLVAKAFGHQNWAKEIDLKSGMPIVNEAAHPYVEKKVENICPPDIGVKNWNPSAFSPRTGLLYAGVFNSCMDLTNHIVQYIPSSPYDGMEMVRHAGPGGNWGEFIAWDPVARQTHVEHQGKSLCVERRGGHRLRPGVLRHHGWLVPRRGCAQRQGIVVAEIGLGHHRRAHDLCRPRQAPVCGGLCRGRRRRRCAEARERLYARRQYTLRLLGGRHGHRQRHHPTHLTGWGSGAGFGASGGA